MISVTNGLILCITQVSYKDSSSLGVHSGFWVFQLLSASDGYVKNLEVPEGRPSRHICGGSSRTCYLRWEGARWGGAVPWLWCWTDRHGEMGPSTQNTSLPHSLTVGQVRSSSSTATLLPWWATTWNCQPESTPPSLGCFGQGIWAQQEHRSWGPTHKDDDHKTQWGRIRLIRKFNLWKLY